jgi:radical SAM protein with 4Fe4S-binding SPASM domain
MLKPQLFNDTIDQLSPQLSYLTMYFQGEPFLNKNFLPMVAYANKKNIYTVTSSNAHYFTEENARKTVQSGLSKVIISIDGISEETYKKYRIGGDLNKVLSGTKELVKQKKLAKSSTPHIVWQFIVFGHNEHELEDVKKMAHDFEVDELAIKTAQIYDFGVSEDLIPKNEEYSRYKKVGDTYKIKNKLLNHCWRMWQGCVITWDGLIAPCCFDKDATHQLGKLETHSLKEIWKSKVYADFRRQVFTDRNKIDICQNCTE